MDNRAAKRSLDIVIRKARVHLYKPIQVAEILYRDREVGDIDLEDLDTYRTLSRKWRDEVCMRILGRSSTSSARFQDNLFDSNATPPPVLMTLGEINRRYDGAVEAYIYEAFRQKHAQNVEMVRLCEIFRPNEFQIAELYCGFQA
jgi:type II restriction enzyme